MPVTPQDSRDPQSIDSRIRVVLVDDKPGYANTLREVLEQLPGCQWAGYYRSPVQFLGSLPQLEADVILLDIEMPKISGVDCIGEIKQFRPEMKVVMLSVSDEDDHVLNAFLNGADGYLLKDATPQQILEAMRATLKGGASMSPTIARKVITLFAKSSGTKPATPSNGITQHGLTRRESELLHHLSQGKRYDEIGKALCISKDTVKTHIRKIYEKLQVRNRSEALSKYLRGS